MGEDDSMRNCTYGFSDNGRDVYSNLNLSCLEDWLDRLEETDRREKFLEPRKNLVVVDLNQKYLDHILETLFPDFISVAEHNKVKTKYYSHHTEQGYVDVYDREVYLDVYDKIVGHPLVKLCSRVKYRDSLTEKLTRQNAVKGGMGLPLDTQFPYHISVRDVLGLNLVAHDKKSRDVLLDRVCSDYRLKLVNIDDKNSSEYKAIHCDFVWRKNTIPEGMLFEIQFETEKEHHENKFGDSGCLSHEEYGDKKLYMPHNQGDNQIIILQKNGHEFEELIPIDLKNKYVKYTLINY